MRYLLIVFTFLIVSGTNVKAEVTCLTDPANNTHCSGTDSAGNTVSTRSYTDHAGTTHTSGEIGNERIDLRHLRIN